MSVNNESCDYVDLPDWPLIDEISIALLEQGIGEFEILQTSLPSVVLAKCDKIVRLILKFIN
jgi:hypothetical protein